MDFSLFNDTAPIGIPLSQFTATITNTIVSDRRLSGVWVIAELSDVRLAGGHCYLELIEKDSTGQNIAKLKANIWRSNYPFLRQKFFGATQKEISSGIKALVRGSVTHHSVFGLSFNITDIDPSYTMGDMERLRREILLRLRKEGLENRNKNLTLPALPQRIAVISAEGAAGYGDFIHQLNNNSDGYIFYPHLFPCAMQGEKVSSSIRSALELIEATIDLWDCVVIIRGGGATTDLNGFDDYDLARAIATFALPVIVGIGHERDRTVLDDIANISLKTPTAVAAFFIERARKAYDNVMSLADKLRSYALDVISGEDRKINVLISFLPQLALKKLEEQKNKLISFSGKIPLLSQGKINFERSKIEKLINILLSGTANRIIKENLKINSEIQLLNNLSSHRIQQSNQKINNLESLIKVLDPVNILFRGYSITRINGKAIKSIKNLKEGDIISTTFPDGEINSTIN